MTLQIEKYICERYFLFKHLTKYVKGFFFIEGFSAVRSLLQIFVPTLFPLRVFLFLVIYLNIEILQLKLQQGKLSPES